MNIERNSQKRKIIILGKLPPPFIGPAIATEIILKSGLKDKFKLIHLDTSDHRDITTLGKFDLKNMILPFLHYFLLIYYIIKFKPSAVYIPSAQTTIAFFRDIPFIIISKIFKKKVICHLRGGNFKNWFNNSSLITRFIVKKILPLIDTQIVLGEKLRFLFNWTIPDERIFVVPNGANYNLQKNSKSHHKNKVIKILYLSNFIRTKGMIDVLNAIPDVVKSHKNVEFIFAGNWSHRETKVDCVNFIKSNPDYPITIKNPQIGKDKFDLYLSCHIFVLPTYYKNEGHPWVIVEAMASGLPIISTDHGAITESVINGINGFIIEKHSPSQLSDKINFLIENTHLRREMGENSRKLYMEKFTEEIMVNKLALALNSSFKC